MLKTGQPRRRITKGPRVPITSDELAELAGRTIAAHKSIAPVILKVKGLCGFADYFLISSGSSHRHVLALAQHLQEVLSRVGLKPLGVEGLEDGNWVLLDYNDVVVHLFLQPLREFYDLEGLWAEAARLPVPDRGPTVPQETHP